MNPVVLVHGIRDTITIFNPMTKYLADHGWPVHRLNLVPNYGCEKLEVLAAQVADYIDNNFAPDTPIDLLGFSMGGLVTRYYLQRLGGIDRVQRYITISAPNHGTLTAYSLPLAGIRQMCPNSEFLADLDRDCRQILGKVKTTIIWTPFDMMIVPARSSCLGAGREIIIPVLLHAWMVRDRRVLATVKEALSEPV